MAGYGYPGGVWQDGDYFQARSTAGWLASSGHSNRCPVFELGLSLEFERTI